MTEGWGDGGGRELGWLAKVRSALWPVTPWLTQAKQGPLGTANTGLSSKPQLDKTFH